MIYTYMNYRYIRWDLKYLGYVGKKTYIASSEITYDSAVEVQYILSVMLTETLTFLEKDSCDLQFFKKAIFFYCNMFSKNNT